MIKATTGSTAELCKYNGEGYRVEKTTNGQVTKYLYEADKVVLELDVSNKQTARNVYGTNLVSRTSGADTMYFMYNGHADVTALIKQDGTIVASYYYDAFGTPTATNETGVKNPYRYAGYQYDSETGLYYLNARMYDSTIARFLQEDTYTGDASDPLSLNLYTYCHNEPIMFWDPTGHMDMAAFFSSINITDPNAKAQILGCLAATGQNLSGSTIQLTGNGKSQSVSSVVLPNGVNAYVGSGVSIGKMTTTAGSSNIIDVSDSSGKVKAGSIGTLVIGGGSSATVINNGKIGYLETGEGSTTKINNNCNIMVISTGEKSKTTIDNNKTIGKIELGKKSTCDINTVKGSEIRSVDTTKGSGTIKGTGVIYESILIPGKTIISTNGGTLLVTEISSKLYGPTSFTFLNKIQYLILHEAMTRTDPKAFLKDIEKMARDNVGIPVALTALGITELPEAITIGILISAVDYLTTNTERILFEKAYQKSGEKGVMIMHWCNLDTRMGVLGNEDYYRPWDGKTIKIPKNYGIKEAVFFKR